MKIFASLVGTLSVEQVYQCYPRILRGRCWLKLVICAFDPLGLSFLVQVFQVGIELSGS
jgi:hypothetical protein